jgi:pyrroloquinoline quinone (PQQ) biosynthesis protein C
VRNFELLGPFCAKIADELISPRAPGHVLVLLQTAEVMGLSRKEMLEDPYLAAARAINDFCHKIFIDGSIAELWGLHVFEESLSHWSGEWYMALTTKYGFSKEQAIYFSTHEEADMDTHKLGEDGEEAMGHGAFNRTVLERALQEGVEFRAGYTMEYCALTMVELHAQMKQAAIDKPYPDSHSQRNK